MFFFSCLTYEISFESHAPLSLFFFGVWLFLSLRCLVQCVTFNPWSIFALELQKTKMMKGCV